MKNTIIVILILVGFSCNKESECEKINLFEFPSWEHYQTGYPQDALLNLETGFKLSFTEIIDDDLNTNRYMFQIGEYNTKLTFYDPNTLDFFPFLDGCDTNRINSIMIEPCGDFAEFCIYTVGADNMSLDKSVFFLRKGINNKK